MEEIWKDICGYKGEYQVSNLGRVKSFKTSKSGKIIKAWIQNTGYYTVAFGTKKYSVHRLVAEAFISNPFKLEQVNHKDGNKLNNNVDNLEWISQKNNIRHAYKTGLMENVKYNNQIIKPRAKYVEQYTLNGEFIKKFLGSVEAAKELKRKNIKTNAGSIRNVCNGTQKTAGGYVWKWGEKRF